MVSRQSGFTLIELMIVLLIVAILGAIAFPNYKDYLLRGKLIAAQNALAADRALMEQYYQDNRTYGNATTSGGQVVYSPCSGATFGANWVGFTASSSTNPTEFTVTCSLTGVAGAASSAGAPYSISAAGADAITNGFTYAIDGFGNQFTVSLPPSWASVFSGSMPAACWIGKRGGSC